MCCDFDEERSPSFGCFRLLLVTYLNKEKHRCPCCRLRPEVAVVAIRSSNRWPCPPSSVSPPPLLPARRPRMVSPLLMPPSSSARYTAVAAAAAGRLPTKTTLSSCSTEPTQT